MRTHSSRSLKIFVKDECGVCMEEGGGSLLVPSCCSLIQSGPNSRHLDQQTVSAYFFLTLA